MESASFPEAMRGNLFSAQHNTRKVMRHALARNGSSFTAESFDFVSSENPDFHPSDVLEAPDGSLPWSSTPARGTSSTAPPARSATRARARRHLPGPHHGPEAGRQAGGSRADPSRTLGRASPEMAARSRGVARPRAARRTEGGSGAGGGPQVRRRGPAAGRRRRARGVRHGGVAPRDLGRARRRARQVPRARARPRGVADRRSEGAPGGADAGPSARPEGGARPAPAEERAEPARRARESRRRRIRAPPGGPSRTQETSGVGARARSSSTAGWARRRWRRRKTAPSP